MTLTPPSVRSVVAASGESGPRSAENANRPIVLIGPTRSEIGPVGSSFSKLRAWVAKAVASARSWACSKVAGLATCRWPSDCTSSTLRAVFSRRRSIEDNVDEALPSRYETTAVGGSVTNDSKDSPVCSAIPASSRAVIRRAPVSILASAVRSSPVAPASSACVRRARARASAIRRPIVSLSTIVTCAIIEQARCGREPRTAGRCGCPWPRGADHVAGCVHEDAACELRTGTRMQPVRPGPRR